MTSESNNISKEEFERGAQFALRYLTSVFNGLDYFLQCSVCFSKCEAIGKLLGYDKLEYKKRILSLEEKMGAVREEMAEFNALLLELINDEKDGN